MLSLAAPAYQEADSIAAVVGSWVAHLRKSPHCAAFEIVVCNDGSSDATGEILDGLRDEIEALRVIHLPENRGAAAALAEAIRATRGDAVLVIDSDGQFPIENLAALAERAEQCEAAVVMGRRTRKADSAFARLGSALSAGVCNRLYGSRLQDFNSALKLGSGPLLRSIHYEARGLNYSTELTAKLLERGVEIVEVEVAHRERIGGKSSLRRVRDAAHRLLFVLYLAYRRFLIARGVIESR